VKPAMRQSPSEPEISTPTEAAAYMRQFIADMKARR
jgi:hypothetical protein